MFSYTIRTRRILCFALLSVMTVSVVILLWYSQKIVIPPDWKIKGLNVCSNDGYISVEWDSINAFNLDSIQIEVKDDNDDLLILEECSPYSDSYKFNEGEHGSAYKFKVSLILSDGNIISSNSLRSVFVNYSNLKDIPLFRIDTLDGENPQCRYVSGPEGSWGRGIADNEYCSAQMNILNDNKKVFTEMIQIRVRGNTSAYLQKKPYRIKVSKAVNLLDLKESKYSHEDWYLIPVTDLKFVVGNEVSKLCGMEWQPRYDFVNVILNGDFLGCYWLVEAVGTGEYRCNIQDSGYMIECDAYWWNSNDEYFKIDDQILQMGYTFKHPSFSDLAKGDLEKIKGHLNDGINYLKNDDARYEQYIDISSWASWLLAHDILGTRDAGGSNMFYYKETFDDNDPFSSKIKMGPVWDFDSSFLIVDYWSQIRVNEHGYFPLLLRQQKFKQVYAENWEAISKTLVQTVDERVLDFSEQKEQGIEQSLYLDSVRWKTKQLDIESQKETIHNWFVSRTEWLNSNIK